jgi:cytochrome c biogenesis protein CcdA/thiol-disulfide isomerase/thioredoxin
MLILLAFAFISGLLTILAPCIWPILPIVLSASTGGKRKPLGITMGILMSFTLFTLSLSYLVKAFGFDPDSLRLFAVIVISFLGLTLVIPSLAAFIESLVSRLTSRFGGAGTGGTGFFGGLITGISLGIVWSPCAGPILATIAALAATRAVNSEVVLVTLAYMAGTGIPLFLFSTLGSNILTKSRVISPYLGKIQQVFGIIMITTALSIWTNYDKVIQTRLLDIFPAYSNLLFKLEENNRVREQLNRLSGRETSNQVVPKSFLPDMGRAPDFVGIDHWLNSEPLNLASLKGKVILVDFWTYSCINCIRTLPFVTGWYEKYKDQGLVVVGVHTPEFEFEKKTANVQNALKTYQITYPVAQDNSYVTWNNFNNSYWPAKYLIDKEGHLRMFHFGEGDYKETEKAIQSLLAETGTVVATDTLNLPDLTPNTRLTPEIYLGLDRMEHLVSKENARRGDQLYSLPGNIPNDSFGLQGTWNISGQYSESTVNSSLSLKFTGSKVFLVITPIDEKDTIFVNLDGQLVGSSSAGKDVVGGKVILDVPRLYELIDLKGNRGTHILRLDFGTKGTQVFAFTFG